MDLDAACSSVVHPVTVGPSCRFCSRSLSRLCPASAPQVWQSTECLVNVCSGLDWKRCVAVHLWYMLPPTASVADALAKYQDAFQVGDPLPHHHHHPVLFTHFP